MQTPTTPDLDTFLTTVYVLMDDLYRAEAQPHLPPRPGARPGLSDSEVLTLAVLAQWQPDNSERAFVAFVNQHWQAYFPRRLTQSAFNRRVRHLGNVLAFLGPRVHQQLGAVLGPRAFEVLDGVPVPLMRRCRGNAHRLFGDEAGIGRGGSDKAWYYGVRLLTLVDHHGFITGWVEVPAPTGERWGAEALFRWRQDAAAPAPTAAELAEVLGPSHHGPERLGPTGPVRGRWSAGRPTAAPVLADLGFTGAAWRAHWAAAYGADVLTKADYAPLPPPQCRRWQQWFNGLRQEVETINGLLEQQFHLWFPRARTFGGLLTRLAAKVTACNIARAVNYQLGYPPHAQINPLAI